MELVLLRHAPAESRDPRRWADDAERPLTREGRVVAQVVGSALERLGVRPSQILASPALRCRDTAELTREALDSHVPVEVWEELSFEVPPERLLARLARAPAGRAGPHLLVGHEPSLGRLGTLLLFGESVASLRLKRGGAAAIETPRRPAPGSGRLQWMLTRRQLVSISGRRV